jgi:hypothetical protein
VSFHVPAKGTASAFVPDGKHEILFVYSNMRDDLFQGDSFTLNNHGVEIRIVKNLGGTIKQIK